MSAQCRGCGKFFQPVCVDHEGGPRVLWTCPDNVLEQQGRGALDLLEVSPGRFIDFTEEDVLRNVVVEDVQPDGTKIVSFYEKLRRVGPVKDDLTL